ncbi:MAG: sigma-70 family RNA polymerase sigma factor [Deltaproteobacteria bacterium]|nr:sigma-70 family RNA polymerase sigma factor [Deltaproteobacteria bacterium]
MAALEPADDFALLSRWGQGDRDAGAELVTRYFSPLFSFFRNRVRQGADDLVQQTLLALLEAAPRFRADASFRSFVFAVARNVLFAHYRATERRAATELDSSVMSEGSTATQRLAFAEQNQQLLVVMGHLPVDDQLILELVYWQGLTGPDLAAAMEIPLDTAYSRLRRAKDRLRKLATEAGVDPSVTHAMDLDDWASALRRAAGAPSGTSP